jgi:hypothetical protein
MEYEFTLKYQLAADDCEHEDIVERLAEAGCDDATIGVGLPGRIALVFARESSSALGALVSALEDVKRAVPSARLVEAAPDFVGLTDVADVAGVSRQNMRKLMLSHAADFPIPVHEGNPSVWHLWDVLTWLKARAGYDISAHVLEVSKSAKQVNLAKEARELEPKIGNRLEDLIA